MRRRHPRVEGFGHPKGHGQQLELVNVIILYIPIMNKALSLLVTRSEGLAITRRLGEKRMAIL